MRSSGIRQLRNGTQTLSRGTAPALRISSPSYQVLPPPPSTTRLFLRRSITQQGSGFFSRTVSTNPFGIQRFDDLRTTPSPSASFDDFQPQKDWSEMTSTEHRDNITTSILNETEYPVGFMAHESILDAESALLSWTREFSPEGFQSALKLLKRLIQEQEGQPVPTGEDAYIVRPFLVNRVVDCWRICWCGGKNVMEPPVMLTTLQDLVVTPDSRALTMVIDAMLKRGSPEETSMVAQWILDQRMEDAAENADLRPDSFLLTSVIRAWAKSGRMEGPEMAEAILGLMHDLQENGWEESGPNRVSYAAVMDAWNQSGHPDGAQAIDQLLDRMKARGVPPDTYIYTLVINAWSQSRAIHSTEKAQERLLEMIELYKNGNDQVVPTASNFGRVMYALARSGNGKQAEILYIQLQDMYEKSGTAVLKPNYECQKALLSALSGRDTARQASAVLDELITTALTRDGLMPRRSYFIDVLVALTKDQNPYTAATESEKLLRRMVDLGHAGFADLMPDSLTFLKVAQAWSRCREKVAVSKVTALLELLEDLYERTGSQSLKPTAKLMEIVVLTLCRSSVPDALEQAEAIISSMEKVYADGDQSMRPRRGIYTSVMQAWVRSNDSRSHGVVQEIFDKLNILYSQGHDEYRPDILVCGTLMASLAQRGDSARVQVMFDALCEEFCNGNAAAKPDMHTFNMILKAWCFSDNPNRGQKAEAALKRIQEINKLHGLDLEPDAHTYLHMIRIWGGSGSPNNAERAEHYLRSMLDSSFDPSFAFCLQILRLWIQKGDGASTGRAAILLEDLIAGVQSNRIRIPSPNQYREFLELVAKSEIGGRNTQARQLLLNLPERKVLRSLMPTDRRESSTKQT